MFFCTDLDFLAFVLGLVLLLGIGLAKYFSLDRKIVKIMFVVSFLSECSQLKKT